MELEDKLRQRPHTWIGGKAVHCYKIYDVRYAISRVISILENVLRSARLAVTVARIVSSQESRWREECPTERLEWQGGLAEEWSTSPLVRFCDCVDHFSTFHTFIRYLIYVEIKTFVYNWYLVDILGNFSGYWGIFCYKIPFKGLSICWGYFLFLG